MIGWNFAEIWERVADGSPTRPPRSRATAASRGASSTAGPTALARHLLDGRRRAPGQGGALPLQRPRVPRVACSPPSRPALVPVNTNYRYADDELVYLWDNADAVAVVFHGSFVERIERIRDRVPTVSTWLWVDDGSGPCPEWATPYEEAAASATERVVAPWGRRGDDLLMLYTGGTTGMPKGVMWRQDDLFAHARRGSAELAADPDDVGGLDAVRGARRRPGPVAPARPAR